MSSIYEQIVNGSSDSNNTSLYKSITGKDYNVAPVSTKATTKKKKKDWINLNTFEDGYNVGDVTKTILSTGGDLVTNATKGMFGLGEGIGDLITYGIAGISELAGKKSFAEGLRSEAKRSYTDEIFSPAEEFYDENSVLGEKLDNIAQVGGSIYGNVALGGFGQGLGLGTKGVTALTGTVNGLSTAGSSMSNAYNSGATNEQAALYGAISGTSSAILNMLVGGLNKSVEATGISSGIGKLDDKLAQTLTKRIENQLVKNITEAGIKAVGEGGESVLRGVVDAFAQKITYMSDSEIEDLLKDEDLLNKFVTGTVTSAVMQAPGVYNSSKNNRDYISGLTKNEKAVYDREIEKRIEQYEKDNPSQKISGKEKNKIYKQAREDLVKGYISTDTIEEALGGDRYEQLKELSNTKDNLEKQINKLQKKIGKDTDNISDNFSFEAYNNYSRANLKDKKKLETLQNELKATEYKIGRTKEYLGNEVSELTNEDDFLQESYKEISRKKNSYKIDLTKKYTEREQNIIQKAVDSGILNDTRKTHEYVDMLAKISEDKGIDFDFTNNEALKNSDLSINGYTKDGTVSLNIDSSKYLNSLLGHELTHVLEETDDYSKLQEAVKKYAETKGDYQKTYDKINDLYKNVEGSDVDNEVTSELIGDYLFTDKDFIDNLSVNDRNLFQKAFNEVKYLSKVATTRSKEKRQLEKVKHLFESAYKENILDYEPNTHVDIKNAEDNVIDSKEEKSSQNTQKVTNTEEQFEEFGRENGTELTNNEIAPIKKNTKSEKNEIKEVDPFEEFGNNIELTEEMKEMSKSKYSLENNSKNEYNSSTLFNQMMQKVKPDYEGHLLVNDADNYYVINKDSNNNFEVLDKIEINDSNRELINEMIGEWDYDTRRKSNNDVIESSEYGQGYSSRNSSYDEENESWFEYAGRILEGDRPEDSNSARNIEGGLQNSTPGELGNSSFSDDIKQSIGNNDIAPIGSYKVTSDDIKIEQDKAPTKNNLGYIPKDPTKSDSYESEDKVIQNELDRMENRINERETAKKNKQMIVSGEKTPWRRARDKFNRLFINSNQELDNLSKESNNPNIKYKADMLNNVYAEAQSNVENAQTDNSGKAIGKSINQLFEPAKENGLEAAFNDYLIHYSNIDRHEHGIGSSVPLNVSEQLVHDYEKAYPEFKEWGQDVWNYGKNAKNNLKDAGIISEELSDKLDEMYPHYVPYIVDKKDLNNYIDDIGEIKPKTVIKRGKGNALRNNILPVEQSLTKYTYAQKNSVRQNELYSEIINTFYDEDNPINTFTLDDTDPSNVKGNLYRDEKGNYLTAFVDGTEKSVQISDDLYDTLNKDVENYIKDLESDFDVVTKPLQKISRLRRDILTKYSPTFPLKNAIKDIQDASFNSKYTKDFAKNYLTSFSELKDENNELANQFKSLYGSGNLMGEYNVDSGLYDGNLKNDTATNKLARVNDIVELAPRYAEFKASIENGATVQEAMYNAREVTTNFSRGGVITKALNRNGFTFLNASVQGLDKFVRNFSGENGTKGIINSTAKAVAFGVAPAIFNDLMFGTGDDKDEDYEALPDYIKDNYYLFKINGNNFIRIPKGRSLSVFGSAGRRALEYINGDQNAFDGYLQNVNSQIGINNPEENNIFAPIKQTYGSENGEAWYGGDLVPTRLQNKPKPEQYDETTDEFSKWLGEKLNQSPYKINYLLDQYSGGIGDIALPMITKEASSDNDSILGTALAPIKDQFVVNSTTDNKYVSNFYDTNDKLSIQANSYNATDDDLLKKKYMSSVSSDLSKLYAEKREVQNDDNLSRSERFKKSQAIKDEINRLAKDGLDTYQTIDKTDNYAVIGDREYYKNNKNEWTKVNQSELDSLQSFGLTTNEKSSYFKTKADISSINNNYKDILANSSDENKDVINNRKKTSVVNAIKGSNLTNEAKAYLYDKNYGDTDTLNALIGLGVSMNQYMDLDSQLFESDKYANGKTVPNSKKNKTFRYINQMDIPFEQKIILAKLKYNNYDDYNYEIINYLNNSDLDYGTQVKLLKKMGFKVYDDGRITW